MSVDRKAHYRFVFLRSEKWKSVRLETLAREKAKCRICGYESICNDAHHVYYPESVWDTKPHDLVILCRPCHSLIHTILNCHRNRKANRGSALAEVRELSDALSSWNHLKEECMGERKPRKRKKPVDLKCKACGSPTLLTPVDVTRVISVKSLKPVIYFLCDWCSYRLSDESPKGWRAFKIWLREKAHKKLLLDAASRCDYTSRNGDRVGCPAGHPGAPSVA